VAERIGFSTGTERRKGRAGGITKVTRALRIETLKQRVARSEYRVDVDKVAKAILGRPTAHLWLVAAPVPVVEPKDDDDGIALPTPAG